MSTVTIGFNGKITADAASNIFGCSYSHVVALINKGKFRTAQRVGKKWMIDEAEVYKARDSGMVVARGKRKEPPAPKIGHTQELPPAEGTVVVRIEIPKEKMELLRIALKGTSKSLVEHLQEKVDNLYTQITDKLNNLEFK